MSVAGCAPHYGLSVIRNYAQRNETRGLDNAVANHSGLRILGTRDVVKCQLIKPSIVVL